MTVKTRGNPHIGVIALIGGLVREHKAVANGKDVTPMRDEAFLRLAEESEKEDGRHPSFRFKINRIIVDRYCKSDPSDSRAITDCEETYVGIRVSQEADRDLIAKLERKYGRQYPKTILAIKKDLEVK